MEKNVIIRETDEFEYGKIYKVEDGKPPIFWSDYIRSKKPLWFAQEPMKIFADVGVATDKRRAADLENFFDGDLNGYYYMAAASDGSDEAAKWLLGAVAAHMNEKNLVFKNINQFMPADYLKCFIACLKSGVIDRTFSKDIFAQLLSNGQQFQSNDDGSLRRLTGFEVLDSIIADPKYKAVDSSEIDIIIDKVIADNPANAAKVAEQPKLAQWFVGQVMKAAKGKASAATVQDKLKARFGL